MPNAINTSFIRYGGDAEPEAPVEKPIPATVEKETKRRGKKTKVTENRISDSTLY